MMSKLIAVNLALVCLTVSPAVAEAHPVILGMSIKNCSSNAAQTASVSLNMAPQLGLSIIRYAFRNMATGQAYNFDRPMNYVSANDFTLPGGNYTMRISIIDNPATGVAVPGSVQLLYDTAIPVPFLSGGVCTSPGVAPLRQR